MATQNGGKGEAELQKDCLAFFNTCEELQQLVTVPKELMIIKTIA